MEQEDDVIIASGGDHAAEPVPIDIPVSGDGDGDILHTSIESVVSIGSCGSNVTLPTVLVLPDDVLRSMSPMELRCLLAKEDEPEPEAEAEPEPTVSRCHIKRIQWFKKDVNIILQNENGPCPLIAIANVMLLRRHLVLEPTTLVINTDKLVELIAECVVEAKPRDIPGQDFQELVQASLESLSGLSQGLNVDVKFSGVTEFENTRELAIFKVLNIPLYHGWVCYNEPETLRAVANLSYNQLTEKMFADRYSDDGNRVIEAIAAENFLNSSASQLTYEGLSQLVDTMKFAEVSVLFRNNHFSTLIKFHTASPMDKPVADSSILHLTRAELYILVTDQGFLNEPNIVWETLTNVENDSTFVDSDFIIPKGKDMPTNSMSATDMQRQVENDYMVAMSLSEKVHAWQMNSRPEQSNYPRMEDYCSGFSNYIDDADLARQLQEQEDGIVNSRMAANAVNTFDPLRASSSESKLGDAGHRGLPVASRSKKGSPPGADKMVGPLVDLTVGLPPEELLDPRVSRSATDSFRSAAEDIESPRAGGTRAKKTDKPVGREPEQQPQAEESCVIL